MSENKGSTSGRPEILSEGVRARLEAKVTVVGDCHIYASSNSARYGTISINGVNRLAHRVAYTLSKGDIPQGAVIMHSCDVRRCVNPEHLTAGSQSENIKDAVAKGRMTGRPGVKKPRRKRD